MNDQIRLAVDTDILGDSGLQERFTAYVGILGQLARHVSSPAGIARIAEVADMPTSAVRCYLRELVGAGILERVRGIRETWRLVNASGDVTLEEVFRCAVAANAKRRRDATSLTVPVGGRDTELLLMQALQTVDNHLY